MIRSLPLAVLTRSVSDGPRAGRDAGVPQTGCVRSSMSIYEDLQPISLDDVTTYPLSSRPSKATVKDFGSPVTENGYVLVHDAEIAMAGSTSEDVDATLGVGAVGGAEETGRLLNDAARRGARDATGLGESLGRVLLELKPQHESLSLLCAAYKARVPFTAFITMGGDIAHFHPSTDGAALGAT